MDSKVIDCCGLSCPEPLIQARKAMQEPGIGEVKIKVNTAVARDNILRAAKKMGWKTQVETQEEAFLLTLTR